MRLFSYIFLFLLTTWQLIAQTYPVQVVPVLTPPYSSKIADYANPMANKVQLQLITTDLSVQNRPVQLYVEIKGNGLTVASAPVLSGVSPLRISGGEILRLTNAELASYFQLRNLQGITSQQYASALPDGMYSFCFRVKDVLSGRWLSQSHCAIAYLMLNDPPILNIPSDNEQVAVTDFQNIIFSWTPRQINATNVTYSFELREILDPTLDPRFAFEVSRRILKEDDLRMTTFVYDVSKPNLIPGRRYAWRVRAISTGGLAENSVFKNNGYSEVHSFVYAVNCSKPLFLLSEQQGKSRTKLLWQGHTLHQKYHIQYRKKNVEGAQWFETFTRNTQTLITDLEAGEYEFRVGATCETERYGINPSYVYSDIQTFKIEKTQNTTESAYNCGIVPKITITNQKPLASLVTNEVFTAGDFAVTLLEVSGSNGVFSGKGFIKVPYLNDTKLAVEFENIKINSDYQLTDGVVKTTYDADWKNVQFIENLIGQGKKSNEINVPFEIDKVETHNGEIVVTGKDGRKEVFPFGGNDSTVKGKVTTTTNGVTTTQEKIYHIDKDGKVSEPQTVAQGGKPTKENTNGVSKGGEATTLTAKGIEVTFENTADSKYAYEVPTKAYSKDYQKLDGKYIPFKAVVKGETEPFLAKVQITDKNIIADSLIFKTDKGALIESKRVEGSNDFLLTLKGFHSFAVEQVQATIKQGKKYQIAGVFNLVHLSPKTAKVVLVPTAENTSMDIDRVKSIYSKIGVTLDITWAAPFDITPYLTNGVLETKDVFGDLTDYSPSQQALINAYKATGKVTNDTYYVFITNAKSSTGQGGYMALGGQFGFVFDQTERTLAHELGHGIFKLAHPFKKKQQGNVPSLMDYTSDEALLFADWKQINDPAFKIGIFQGQSEGEFAKGEFARYVVTPDFRIVDIPISNSMSYDGYNLNIPPGTCPGFVTTKTIDNTKVYYVWNNEHKYYENINDPSDYKSFSTIQHPDDKILIFLFYNYGNCPKSSGAYLELSFSEIKDKYQSAKGLIAIIQKYRNEAKVLPCANANTSEKVDDNINGVALDCTAENVKEILKKEIEAINAITSNSTAKEINKALQSSFYNCVYANIDIDKRITILDKLLKEDVDDSLWEFEKGLLPSDDIFFLDNLILSTPEKDRVRLLKEGFMKNNSEWLRVIFNKAKGSNIANNDVTLRKDVIQLFTSLSSWVSQYYNKLGIKPTLTGIITNFPNLEIYQYPIASVKPVLLATSADKELFKIGEYINGAIYDYKILSAYSVNFKKDNTITFRYDINKEVVSTQFSTPGKSPATIYENYSLTVNPFEPVIIKAPRNYLSLQIKENEEYIVPAFLAAAYQQAIIDDKNSEIIHSLGDKALMTSAVATSLFTGGSSYGAYLTYVAGIAAAGNDLIREERKNLDRDESYREKYAFYYEAWDSFYGAVQIAAVADAAYTLANNISKINFITKAKSFYTKMKTFDFQGKLKSTWEALSRGEKINEVVVSSDELKKLGWATDDINLFNNTFKGAQTLENAKSWKLLKEAGSKYVFKDKKLFEKFTKLNPEVQQYVAKFSDKDANSTLIKFLDDCEDAEFLKFINERPNLSEAFVGHKNSWTHTDFENIAENLTDISSVGVSALQKTQKWIDRSSDLAKFGKVTELGRSLNGKIVNALKQKQGKLFDDLAQATGIPVQDLQKYDILTEVPLETTNGFMKADIVLILKNDREVIQDAIIIENKLSKSTAFTERQKEGFGAILNGQKQITIKYGVKKGKTDINNYLNASDKISISKDRIFKISDGGTDNISKVTIEKITNVK